MMSKSDERGVFKADSLSAQLAWSYLCVLRIGELQLDIRHRNVLWRVFRMWPGENGIPKLSLYAQDNLIMKSGNLMPFAKWARLYGRGSSVVGRLTDLGDIGEGATRLALIEWLGTKEQP